MKVQPETSAGVRWGNSGDVAPSDWLASGLSDSCSEPDDVDLYESGLFSY